MIVALLFVLAALLSVSAHAIETLEPAATASPMLLLSAHAASIAGVLRFAVYLARNKKIALWDRIPVRHRPLALILAAGGAAVFENVALGMPIEHSIMSALGGLMGAVSSHEMVERARVKPSTAEPSAASGERR